jgi:outer membrane autotransporter protein
MATAIQGILRGLDMPSRILSAEMRSVGGPGKPATTASARQYAGPESSASAPDRTSFNRTFWAQPFYFTGKQSGSGAFADMDEEFWGLSLGFAVDTGPVVLSLSGHYIGSIHSADAYDADGTAFGLNAGIGRRFIISPNFNPWTELRLGYTRHGFDQTREDMDGRDADSTPDADIFSAGLLVSNDIRLGSVTLTPSLALDYTRLDMGTYTEKGSDYRLEVDPTAYESLRVSAGLSLTRRVAETLDVTGRASYAYEFADTRTEMNSRAVTMPSIRFVTKGEDLDRSSGMIGAGLAWKPSDSVSLALDYDLHLGDKYTGHQVMGAFKMSF